MKNRIIIIAGMVIPILLYWVMANFIPQTAQHIKNSYQATAQNQNGAKIIKFYTPMCLDCQKLDRTLEKVMPKYSSKVTLERIDASSSRANIKVLVAKYGVKVVPTTVFINADGKIVNKIEGDIPQAQLETQIKAIY